MILSTAVPRPIAAAREAFTCLGFGLRDAIRLRSVLISAGIWVFMALFWVLIFLFFGNEIRDTALAILSKGLALVLNLLPQTWATWLTTWNSTFSSIVRFLALFVLLIGLFWTFFILSVRVVVELFLIGLIQRQILPAYPGLKERRPGLDVSFSSAYLFIRNSFVPFVGFSLLFVCLMLIPVINGIALFVLVSYFNVRFLMNDAMDGLASGAELRAYLQTHRLELLILGVLISLLNLIPLVFLLSPWVIGASVCHLSMRHLARLER